MMTSTATDNIQETIQHLLQTHNVSFENGLTSDEVQSRREDVGYYNTVLPPIQCPAWICCLLPCIRHIPSMKLYQQILPEDTEVRRNQGKYIRYDATTLVCGDIIRIADGDIIPADCIVLQLETDELLIDHRYITGDEKPVSIVTNKDPITAAASAVVFNVNTLTTLYWGGRVVLGSGIAICTAVGPNTYVSKLIQAKRFPPSNTTSTSLSTNEAYTEEMVQLRGDVDIESNQTDDNENRVVGIALLRQNSRDGSSTRAV